jgi:ATP synthase protein I
MDKGDRNEHEARGGFLRGVADKERRRIWAIRRGDRSIWEGFGVFGVVGWSVALPTLVGAAAGIWIDARWPSRFSWTLMLTFGGLVVGCLNAWRWVDRERREIERERRGGEDEP